MNDEVCEVIVTAPEAEWLVEFTRRLVIDRIAASGHNITPVRSIYRWQGEIYDKAEARVALHTRRSLVPQIIERANREHPYEVPCVAAMTFDGNPAYVQWVLNETDAP
ncbi:divalent-cation tolerance protein CutA [Actinoplanes derwentensis]|uniref:Divalent cation tolerance protein n=1 Tax=Actinoplanes derwentensis TaxID=113562 RepID=A0A1H2CIL8_9ACTN|nr:divalent-cation tolerance protein CutA [Actinoplanes derwentensis]GID82561.1 divalent-cation tolerance protein CutA [Actinoplanes derwentensis]SDT70375.1 divalent cation tolerance protein [Actinoplanes derwentensis]